MGNQDVIYLSDLVDRQDEFEYVDITYLQENFDKEFTEIQRTYRVYSENNYFDSEKISTSIFGSCLDGTDDGVRLDWYNWKIEKMTVNWY